MGVTPFQAVPGNRAGCRGTRGARPRSCRACPPLAGGARCPPRGPGMWWHSSPLAHLWGWGRGGGRGGRAGTPCTIPMDGIDCPKGPPPRALRDGEGSRPAGLHPMVHYSKIWGGRHAAQGGAPVLTLPAAGISFPGGHGGPAGARTEFPFWQRGQGRSQVSVVPGVPWEQGCALPQSHSLARVAGQPHPAPALTPKRGLGSKTHRSLHGGLSPGEGGGQSPLALGCPEHPAAARKDGTASPSCSIPARPLGPGLCHSPQAHPHPLPAPAGHHSPEVAIVGVRTPSHPPPSPLPQGTAKEGMGTGTEAAFTWG